MPDAYGNIYGDLYGAGAGTGTPTPPPDPTPGATPRPVVQVGFGTDPLIGGGTYLHWSDPARLWDQALWAPDDVWSDVTPWLQTWSFRRGANRVEGPIIRHDAGTATIVLNNADGRFNPLHLTGPYVSGARTQVRPMVPVRIGISYDGTTYWQFTGYADGWNSEYIAPDYARTTLTATDAQKIFGRARRVARTTPVGAGERPGTRVHRILDSANWPTADRVVQLGETTLQGTTLDGDPWSEVLLVQDTEIGAAYMDAVGRVVLKGRHASLQETTATTSQGIFGRDIAAGELPHADLLPEYDDAQIRNVWRIARVGGAAQEARDEESIRDNLEIVHERTDLLMQTDADALAYAQYGVAQTSDAVPVFSSLVVDPRADTRLWPQVLQRDIGHRVTVRSRPPGVGLVERDVWIQGIAGEYGGTNRWKFTWQLQPATTTTYLVWDVGRWNQGAWAL